MLIYHCFQNLSLPILCQLSYHTPELIPPFLSLLLLCFEKIFIPSGWKSNSLTFVSVLQNMVAYSLSFRKSSIIVCTFMASILPEFISSNSRSASVGTISKFWLQVSPCSTLVFTNNFLLGT